MKDTFSEPPPALLLKAVEQFNRGEFFEQHETLETLWRAEVRPVRLLYQGILQIGVACHHLKRGNHNAAMRLLRLGLEKLDPFPATCQRVDVCGFRQSAQRTLTELERLETAGVKEPAAAFDWSLAPKVRLREV